jgi:drug/metabolite transporter (DMT)-like permease
MAISIEATQTAVSAPRAPAIRLGSVLVAASAVAYSTAGFFTRLIDLDVATLLLWRGLFAGLFMLLCIALIERRGMLAAFRAVGVAGLAVAILSALATVCYLSALRLTTVAEVMAINATSPFISGALAWLIIGERERWSTIVASLVALAGIVVMVGPDAMAGELAGAALAFAMTLALALMIVIMRLKKSISMLPASCLSAFLSAAIAWPVSSGAIPGSAMMICLALFGIVQFGLGLILLTLGVRLISALRSSLLSRLQTVLGPIWVWLAFGEVPAATTLLGITLVAGSAFAATVIGARSER